MKKSILAHFTDFNHHPRRREKNTFGALGYYRTFKPAKMLERDYDVDIVGTEIDSYGPDFATNWQSIFNQYDMIWIMHYLSESNAATQAFFREQTGKKLVYDIDDNYLDVPESNPVHENFKKGKRNRAILSTSFFFADALTVSTEPLKERLERHFWDVHHIKKPIFIIPNMNDIRDWQYTPAPKDPKRTVIGYSGSNSHQDDLLFVLPVIDKLMGKYPDLWFELIGAIDKNKLHTYFKDFTPKHLERVAMVAYTPTFWEYPEHLAKQPWDIGIAPLVDTAFTRCKSHIKWMEYSMYQIPTVASRVYPYFMELTGRKTITDGETGFLCRTQKEWETKLEKLILDKELRKRIGKQAYEHVKKTWQYDADLVNDAFDRIFKL